SGPSAGHSAPSTPRRSKTSTGILRGTTRSYRRSWPTSHSEGDGCWVLALLWRPVLRQADKRHGLPKVGQMAQGWTHRNDPEGPEDARVGSLSGARQSSVR